MAFRRRFPRRRFSRFSRRSRADVQTLSMCNNAVQVDLTNATQILDCAHPLIVATPILTTTTPETGTTSPFVASSTSRGISFKGAKYKYMFRAGEHNGTDSNSCLSFTDIIYICWVKMPVNPELPTTPLFLPNLAVGGLVSTIAPVNDPQVEVLHRDIVELTVRPALSCDICCPQGSTVFQTPSQTDIYFRQREAHSVPYHSASVRSRRFLKENEAIFMMFNVVSGSPVGISHAIGWSLFGHIALKQRF